MLLVVLVGAGAYVYANRPPAASLPAIIPTFAPEPTRPVGPVPTVAPVPTLVLLPTLPSVTAEPTVGSGATEPPPQTETPTTGTGPGPSTIPGTQDQGLILGEPFVIDDPSLPQVALLVQNVDTVVKTYTLKATFKSGDTITATADGFVNDDLPGTIRTPALYIDGTPGPGDTITVQVDTMIDEEPSTDTGDIAKQVTFGPPTITTGDFPTVDVEVTNGSQTAASLTIDVGVLRDGKLVGVGTGLVSDVVAGGTKTATLYVTGSVEETDQLLLTVSSVITSG